ncbi:LuxR family transcriptional regulator [Streptomyces sp. 71268]|uniref:helix-turn-helix transcriptional regulator n=1 Tax=Streptomyces sp. 71268 TaxID=3002640 RepID=UPI0023F61B2F|nr:LuxR family transcriptional regulator [Streptomyces sp. 71268]WEV27104.1 LuxR family transcriptional regulator [Streptomyces sp. 71268]
MNELREFVHAATSASNPPTEDDIAQELLAVRALVESTVVKHRDRQSRNSWVATVGSQENDILVTARKLFGEARESVDIVLAGDAGHAQVLYSALGDWLSAQGGDGRSVDEARAAARSGTAGTVAGSRAQPDTDAAGGAGRGQGAGRRAVRARLLCAPGALDRQFVQRHAGGPVPLEVRVARIPLLAAVVVDGRAALVCADAAVGRRASTIRDPGVIEAMRTLFTGIWRKSLAAGERLDDGDRSRKEMLRQILEWLRLGVTDEVAARELSVSVRTYRRYVAEMMSLLGADSRFQAGVRAAELGLLPAAPAAPSPSPQGPTPTPASAPASAPTPAPSPVPELR